MVGVPYPEQTWVDFPSTSTPQSAARWGVQERGIADAHGGLWGVPWMGFQNQARTLTNDQVLDAFVTYASAQTYPPALIMPKTSSLEFLTANRTPYEGLRIWGSTPGYQNPERSSGAAGQGTRIVLNFTGPWWNATAANTFQCSFGQLAFRGGSNASILGNSGSGTWYCLHMRDIFASNMRTVLGTQATKLLITAAQFDGAWEINNSYNGAFHLGGSDNTLWPAGMLLDSATAFLSAGGSTGQYHLWCDFLEKTSIGPLYITAEQGWGGIRVTGPTSPNSGASNAGIVTFLPGLKVEGRNSGQPCYGSLIRVEGGQIDLPYAWLSYAMSSPSSMGHTPTDAAAVDVLGGVADLHGCRYDRATGVAEAVPFVNVAAGAEAWVTRQKLASRGGTWSGRPIVKNSGGAINYDSSVTVV